MAAATATAAASLSLPGAAARSPPPAPAAFLRFCSSFGGYPAYAAKHHRQQLAVVVSLAAAPFGGGARSSRKRRCSAAAGSAGSSSEKWVLEPAGDGDWRHIGYSVARPGAIEIPTSGAVVTVGRVAEKADAVLPVATVSGAHALLEAKADGTLAVTDMDSTNGTYVNERKLVPGFAVAVNPGSLLIFGDIHLAMFRVTKVVVDVPPVTPAGAGDDEAEAKIEVVSVAEETSS